MANPVTTVFKVGDIVTPTEDATRWFPHLVGVNVEVLDVGNMHDPKDQTFRSLPDSRDQYWFWSKHFRLIGGPW